MVFDDVVTLASMGLERRNIVDLNHTPAVADDVFFKRPAAKVTLGRAVPSISARNSCEKLNGLMWARSAQRSSQRARR
jgi:hypothetical protein